MDKKIFVMGGGGFAMEADNLLLDKYLLSLSRKKRPKVCFIPTASGDSDDYIIVVCHHPLYTNMDVQYFKNA